CDLDRPVWKIAPAVVVAEDRFPKRVHWPHNVRQRHALVLDARARVSLRSVPHQVVERARLPGGFCEIVDRRDQVRFQDFAISLADVLERRDERLRRREWMGITAVLNLQPFSILGDYAGHSGRGITNRYRHLRNGRQAEDAGARERLPRRAGPWTGPRGSQIGALAGERPESVPGSKPFRASGSDE